MRALIVLLLTTAPALATTYFSNPPFTFIQGAPGDTCASNPPACAKSSEVNANFSQLVANGNAGYTALKASVNAITGSGAPLGAVIAVNSVSCPSGFIIANGAPGVPDARGVFIRGLDLGAGVDTGRSLNTYQADQFQTHGHADINVVNALTGVSNFAGGGGNPYVVSVSGAPVASDTTSGTAAETRPNAVVLLYCYKNV